MSPARNVALEVLLRVYREGAWAERALHALFSRAELDPRDRSLATELVYGTLRQQVALDYQLAGLAQKPLRKLPQDTLALLRLGAYQLLHTRLAEHAAVSETVAEVKRRRPHQAGFANFVLRELLRRRDAGALRQPGTELSDPTEALAVETSQPSWVIAEVAAQVGFDEAAAWARANNEKPKLSLRANCLRGGRAAVLATLAERGITAEVSPAPEGLWLSGAGDPTELPGFAQGAFTVQDAAAQLVGLMRVPQPGEVVLDACAAPGGKATHHGELMAGTGTVLAVDVHAGKTRLIAENARRLGLGNVVAKVADATSVAALRDVLRDSGREAVDVVLLDAPCSGLGTLRRNPELRSRKCASLDELTALQDKLLDACCQVLRPGGALIYTVCTVTRAEGPSRTMACLRRHPELVLVRPEEPALQPYLEPLGDAACLRTWTHRHGMDSFFAALLLRRSN